MIHIIRIGKIRISIIAVILLPCLLILEGSNYIIYILLFALLHEASHIAAMKLMGVALERIEIHPFSASIEYDNRRMLGYRQEFIVAAAGPLCNILSAVLLLAIFRYFPLYHLPFIIVTNVMLALINLLPISTLDGGRMLQCILMSTINVYTAEKICSVVSAISLALLTATGVLIFSLSGWNVSLLGISLYMAFILYFKNRKQC